MNERKGIVQKIVKILDSKKARDISVLDIAQLTTIADYFIIATGGSTTQVQALCDNIEEALSKDGLSHTHKEGYHTASWILLDYDGIIVHIFLEETREFYKLEHLWSDAERIDISEMVGEVI